MAWLVVVVVVNEVVKVFENQREVTMQKRAALLHGTRLGMHSPK